MKKARDGRSAAQAAAVEWGLGAPSERAFLPFLTRLIEETGVKSVCEVGGGESPALDLDEIGRRGLEYTLLDISAEELAKAPDGYRKVVADITSEHLGVFGPYDFVFSKMLAEHVRDPRQFHANVLSLLRPGGIAFHFFPSLYSVPFVVNRLLPERASKAVLRRLRPGRYRNDTDRGDKFPAYYRWCRGPSRRQLAHFEDMGFEVEQYLGLFGTTYYERMGPLQRVEDALSAQLVRHPVAAMTSYCYVVLRRPGGPDDSAFHPVSYDEAVRESSRPLDQAAAQTPR